MLLLARAASEICANVIDKEEQIFYLTKIQRFDAHHIVPLTLGGTNDPNNLVLVNKSMHEEIHDYIDSQGRFEIGERGSVLIPHKSGLIWGLKP
jgi:hypothetical protein